MTILHIDSSITGENSVSRQVSRRIVDQIRLGQSDAHVIERDLVETPLNHLTLPEFADETVLDEFLAADTLVIGAPMYNFSVPSQLKAWIDRILIAGKTFAYGESGPKGLAGGKRVIIALARGGFYGEGTPAAALEHVETYLRGVFNFIGIEPEFVRADGIAIGPEYREKALVGALDEVERLAA
jgi:FMN-dependent NADH-azoreductase